MHLPRAAVQPSPAAQGTGVEDAESAGVATQIANDEGHSVGVTSQHTWDNKMTHVWESEA